VRIELPIWKGLMAGSLGVILVFGGSLSCWSFLDGNVVRSSLGFRGAGGCSIFFFFLNFAALGFELKAYSLSHSTSLFLWWVFLGDRVLRTICLGWLPTSILLICASWVARITGVSLSREHFWRSVLIYLDLFRALKSLLPLKILCGMRKEDLEYGVAYLVWVAVFISI
jgi:hypothetical protein